MESTSKNVEKVDTDLITLHQNVTQLSIEVRNAIQALQDFTFSSIQSQADLNSRFPARSIPNLPGRQMTDDPGTVIEINEQSMTRSTSHPPEMWGREISVDNNGHLEPFLEGIQFFRKPSLNLPERSSSTQTENSDLETIQRIVRTNPRLVLSILILNIPVRYRTLPLCAITEMAREGAAVLAETPTQEVLVNGVGVAENDKNCLQRPVKLEKHVSIQEVS